MKNVLEMGYDRQSRKEELESPMIDLTTISKATGNFSSNKKLGEGGFGIVYKEKKHQFCDMNNYVESV
ncbi:hypothetical protein OIU74_006113 [Salix koriyanagi]|uniref:Uncharacterized protein n=1 Tax=Salix koriyanagi TaxID=2511006 RepID=A0A9Q0UDN0_9ROSI|nr:hypothetical protein OIU74_006113 [Salix koriyanagi]